MSTPPPTPGPGSGSFAYNARAEANRAAKAKVLARWCYERGIDEQVVELDQVRLRAVARAAGVSPPHQEPGGAPTWKLVAQLLVTRRAWDLEHGVVAPVGAECIRCVVDGSRCEVCMPALLPEP